MHVLYSDIFKNLIVICITGKFKFLADSVNFLQVFRIIKLHLMMTGNAVLPPGTCLGVGIVNIKVCAHFNIKLKLAQKD